MTRGERIALAMKRRDLNQEEVAAKLGVDQTIVSKMTRGVIPGDKHLRPLAKLLDVPLEWLTVGHPEPGWVPARRMMGTLPPSSATESPLALVGVVKAGDGDLAEFVESPPTPFPLKASWRVVQVQGWSAYPVVFPDQFVITDEQRATRPEVMTDAQRHGLHDNIVICQVTGAPPLAYLKRFCHAPGAPGGFILASVDSGRGSPYVDPAAILIIEPVVGVLFEDPRKPRKKRGPLKREGPL